MTLNLCKVLYEDQSIAATDHLLKNLVGPIATEDPAARTHLEARIDGMDESIKCIHESCKVLEKRMEKHVEFGLKANTGISERFEKSISVLSKGILESTREVTKEVANKLSEQIVELTKHVATLESRIQKLETTAINTSTTTSTTANGSEDKDEDDSDENLPPLHDNKNSCRYF